VAATVSNTLQELGRRSWPPQHQQQEHPALAMQGGAAPTMYPPKQPCSVTQPQRAVTLILVELRWNRRQRAHAVPEPQAVNHSARA
jgi:hypothetical protein